MSDFDTTTLSQRDLEVIFTAKMPAILVTRDGLSKAVPLYGPSHNFFTALFPGNSDLYGTSWDDIDLSKSVNNKREYIFYHQVYLFKRIVAIYKEV